MRPVNLIPPEERRGEQASLRTGALPYVLLGGLVLALLAIGAVTVTGNQISDREAEKASLEAREQQAAARAEALAPYAEFAALAQLREQTVTSLAHSRFDWERVLRELALVIPEDVWLTELSGAASPDVSVEDAASVSLSGQVAGPALAIVGCGTGHEAVAGFVEALKDIDGVTRVGVAGSERSSGGGGGAGSGAECRTRRFISKFQLAVAFDEVVVPEAAPGTPVPEPPAPSPEGEELSDAREAEQGARDSAAEQSGEAQSATNLIPGVAR